LTKVNLEPPTVDHEKSGEESPIRVLHVDDEAGLLKVAKQILEMQGNFEVETAASVEEAQEKMRKKEFDVIVSDYIMPGKDGLEFLKELRDSSNNIPFIIFTGKGREIVAIKALNLGANQYINKIGKPEAVYSELAHGILTVVKGKKAEEALEKERQELNRIVDSSPIIIFYKDKKGKFGRVNKAFAEALKISKEEFLGKTVFDLFSSKIAQSMTKDDSKVLESGRPKLGIIEPYESASGIRWVQTDKVPVLNENGSPIGLVGFAQDITERKKAEEELRKTKNYLSNLLDYANAPIIVWDNKKRITLFNNAFASLTGYKKEAMLGRKVDVLFPPLQKEEILQTIEKTMKGEKWKSVEISILCKDKETKIVLWNSASITDKEGKTVATIAQGHDITERKQMENKILQQNEFLNSALEALTHPFYVIDADDYTIQLANSATGFANLAEHSTCYQVIHKRKKPCSAEHPCPLEIVKKTKKPAVTEHIHYDKNGYERIVEVHGYPIFDNDGNVVQIIGYSLDITQRKKVEEALRESEKKYREMINGLNDTIWVIDFDGNFIDVNDAAVEVLGYSREELLSMGPQDIDSSLDAEEIRGLIKGMPSDEIQVFETAHTTKDGKKIPVEISSSLVTYQGKLAILSIARDITGRKKAEKALNGVVDELSLVNEKLGVVGKLTRHDVRNKLSAVTGNLYLAKQALPSDSESVKYLNETESTVEQIESIFDFARTYEQLGVEELSYVDVGKSFGAAVSLLPDLRGIEVANDCKGLSVLADSLLGQLFYNLMDNSLRHGEKVSRIRIYHKVVKDGLKLVYEDNGVGVPKAEKEKIFGEGYGKGTGIGLHMMKIMCRIYGWTIQERGKSEKGAQFTITIPKMNANGKIAYELH